MLLKKMLRDFRLYKMQFTSIFLMAFLAVYVYAGIGGEWHGIQQVREKYYRNTNLADAWVYGKSFSAASVTAVKKVAGINEVQRRLTLDGIANEKYLPTIRMNFIENNEISKPMIMKGKEFDVNDTEGIWLDQRFAAAHNLHVGDRFQVTINSTILTKTIAGLILNPEYGYYSGDKDLFPNFSRIGYAYCSVKAFPLRDFLINSIKNNDIHVKDFLTAAGPNFETSLTKLGLTKDRLTKDNIVSIISGLEPKNLDNIFPYNDLLLKTDRKDILLLEEDINKALNGKYGVFLTREDFTGVATLDAEVNQHKAMSNVFPIAFAAIALLAIITTMSRLVSQQRSQIGTLKALGFSRNKILRHYLTYALFLSLPGAFAGSILGPLSLPYMFYPSMSSYYSLPEWKPGYSPMFFLMVVIISLACIVATYLSCHKVMADSPAETLRPKSPDRIHHTSLERSKIWERLSFGIKWNLRDMTRSKVRTVMGFVGTMSCMALLVCALGMNDTMADVKVWLYDKIQSYNTQITFDDSIRLEEAEDIAADVQGELLMNQAIEIKAHEKKKSMALTVVGDEALYHLTDSGRNDISIHDGEIALSRKAAEILNVRMGDSIRWHPYGNEKWVTSKISLINRIPTGQGITLTKSTYEAIGYDFLPNSVVTNQSFRSYDNSHVISVFTKAQFSKAWDSQMEAMNTIGYVMIFAAALLAVVVLYNLGLLSFTEREKELATLKVIGFRSSKIRSLLLVQNILLASAGTLVGIPVGMWILNLMLKTSGQDFDMMSTLSLRSFLISAGITFGLSLLVNLMFAGKIKRLDMVTSLKGME